MASTRSGGLIQRSGGGGVVPMNGFQAVGGALEDIGSIFLRHQMRKEEEKIRAQQLKNMETEQRLQQQRIEQEAAQRQIATAGLTSMMQQPELLQLVQQQDPTLFAQMKQAHGAANLPGLHRLPQSVQQNPEFQKLAEQSRIDGAAQAQALQPRMEGLRQKAATLKGIDDLIADARTRMASATSDEERSLAQTDIQRLQQIRTVASANDAPQMSVQDLIQSGTLSKGEAQVIELQTAKFALREAESQYEANETAMETLRRLMPELQNVQGVDRSAASTLMSIIATRDAQREARATQSHDAALKAKAAAASALSSLYGMHVGAYMQQKGANPAAASQAAMNLAFTRLEEMGFGAEVAEWRAGGRAETLQQYAEGKQTAAGYIQRRLDYAWNDLREEVTIRPSFDAVVKSAATTILPLGGPRVVPTSYKVSLPKELTPEQINGYLKAAKVNLMVEFKMDEATADFAIRDARLKQEMEQYNQSVKMLRDKRLSFEELQRFQNATWTKVQRNGFFDTLRRDRENDPFGRPRRAGDSRRAPAFSTEEQQRFWMRQLRRPVPNP